MSLKSLNSTEAQCTFRVGPWPRWCPITTQRRRTATWVSSPRQIPPPWLRPGPVRRALVIAAIEMASFRHVDHAGPRRRRRPDRSSTSRSCWLQISQADKRASSRFCSRDFVAEGRIAATEQSCPNMHHQMPRRHARGRADPTAATSRRRRTASTAASAPPAPSGFSTGTGGSAATEHACSLQKLPRSGPADREAWARRTARTAG